MANIRVSQSSPMIYEKCGQSCATRRYDCHVGSLRRSRSPLLFDCESRRNLLDKILSLASKSAPEMSFPV